MSHPYIALQPVSAQKMEQIVTRLTKPTIASRGGIDLADKKFEYVSPQKLKTLPVIDGLDRRFQGGGQRLSKEDVENVAKKLSRPTVASSGGEPLRSKKFNYAMSPKLKTLPDLPGVTSRFLGRRSFVGQDLENIVGRLTNDTVASLARKTAIHDQFHAVDGTLAESIQRDTSSV